ncbi:MAG: ABC transporter ATP-binding protein [Eubacteriales bacterium]|nr:ABC transporter ATP-binding protein [Eubacteriales bacterium]
MSEYLLSTNRLTKEFKHHKAVNEVNLHIKKGAVYGFIGRNGAGKTTFMKMISGLSAPTSGDICFFGYTGTDLKKVRNRIGCLIEEPGLYPNMNAYDNIKLKCLAKGLYKKEYVQELLETAGLQDTGNKKVKKFSLGMKQRLGIALALVGEPDLLVLDEPINGLDPQGIAEVRETIQKLNAEHHMTLIISSHILGELSKLATDYGIIHNGVLIQEVTAEELRQQCQERIEVTLKNPKMALPVLDELGITRYNVVDKEHIHIYEHVHDSAHINAALVNAGNIISEIRIRNEELENYYFELTGGIGND